VYQGNVPTAVTEKAVDTLQMSRGQYIGGHTLSDTYKYVTGQDLLDAHDAGVDVAANMTIFAAMENAITPQEIAELQNQPALTKEESVELARLQSKRATDPAVQNQQRQAELEEKLRNSERFLTLDAREKLTVFDRKTQRLVDMKSSSPRYSHGRHEYRTWLSLPDWIETTKKAISDTEQDTSLSNKEKNHSIFFSLFLL
jgi:hypothetical protein